MKTFLFSLLSLFALPIFSQSILATDAKATAFYNKALPVIKPGYKSMILKTSAALKGKTVNVDSLKIAFKKDDQLKSLNDQSIEVLVLLVMTNISNEVSADLKNTLSDIQKSNGKKDAMRDSSTFVDSIFTKHRPGERIKVVNYNADKKDAMNELSETQQMRLQTYMDRKTKAMETISNLMKKYSDTQDTIINNLK